MKSKLLFMFILINYSVFSQTLQINQVTTTAVLEGLNVNVLVTTFNGSGYLSNSYTVTNNTINISVCYWFDNTLPIIQIGTNILINVPNDQNYTINLSTFHSSSNTVCDYFAVGPTASRQYLDNDKFEKNNQNFNIYPNPSNGIFYFNVSNIDIKEMFLYDYSGKIIKKIEDFSSNKIDLSSIDSGIYLIKIVSDNSIESKKIIIQK